MCIQREAVTVVEAAATYPDFTFPLCTAALWHLDCLHFSFFVSIHFNSNAGVYIESELQRLKGMASRMFPGYLSTAENY